MEKINLDFNVPYYIFEEIVEYIELTKNGACKITKWDNIKSLIKLAIFNGRLTKEQGEYLINQYDRNN